MVGKSLIKLVAATEFAPHTGKGLLRLGAVTLTVAGLGGAGLHAIAPISARLVSEGTVLAPYPNGSVRLAWLPHALAAPQGANSSKTTSKGPSNRGSGSGATPVPNANSGATPTRTSPPQQPNAGSVEPSPSTPSSPSPTVIPSEALENPSANLPDSFYSTCAQDNSVSGPNSYGCQVAAIAAIDQAHADEGIAPLSLPSNYYSLTPAEQLFVLVNEERVERGLPAAVGIATSLATDALGGSESNTDPSLGSPPGQIDGGSFYGTIGANWAADYSTAATVFDWMYADGWAGSTTTNEACTSAGASGCWQHRANILAAEPSGLTVVMGTASMAEPSGSAYQGLESDSMIIASVMQSEPLSYTWAQAVQAGA